MAEYSAIEAVKLIAEKLKKHEGDIKEALQTPKTYNAQEAVVALRKAMRERIDAMADEFVELRKMEDGTSLRKDDQNCKDGKDDFKGLKKPKVVDTEDFNGGKVVDGKSKEDRFVLQKDVLPQNKGTIAPKPAGPSAGMNAPKAPAAQKPSGVPGTPKTPKAPGMSNPNGGLGKAEIPSGGGGPRYKVGDRVSFRGIPGRIGQITEYQGPHSNNHSYGVAWTDYGKPIGNWKYTGFLESTMDPYAEEGYPVRPEPMNKAEMCPTCGKKDEPGSCECVSADGTKMEKGMRSWASQNNMTPRQAAGAAASWDKRHGGTGGAAMDNEKPAPLITRDHSDYADFMPAGRFTGPGKAFQKSLGLGNCVFCSKAEHIGRCE